MRMAKNWARQNGVTTMGRLSTHVLDTASGCPAEGVMIRLDRMDGASPLTIRTSVTNKDGRTDQPLLEAATYQPGTYVLTFFIRAYFEKTLGAGHSPFLDEIPIRFTISEVDGHYHVPLLVSPWSFSTYRGS